MSSHQCFNNFFICSHILIKQRSTNLKALSLHHFESSTNGSKRSFSKFLLSKIPLFLKRFFLNRALVCFCVLLLAVSRVLGVDLSFDKLMNSNFEKRNEKFFFFKEKPEFLLYLLPLNFYCIFKCFPPRFCHFK